MAEETGHKHKTFFSDDTVALKFDPTKLGVIEAAWHEIDNYPESDEDIYTVIAAVGTTQETLKTYRETAQPPRHYHILSFVTPSESTLLVHESQLALVDRAFSFGDVVKRHATDAMSGVVINHRMNLKLRHCFAEDEGELEEGTAPPQTSMDSIASNSSRTTTPESKRTVSPSSPRRRKKPCIRPSERLDSWNVKDVPDEEVTLATEWDEGDYVIWKNTWLGIVEDVSDDVAIKLSNGYVVVPEDCSDLEIPCIKTPASVKAQDKEIDLKDEDGYASPPTIVAERLAVGQQVTTLKSNLRRGRWIYGSYDPSVAPIGLVVEVRTRSLSVHWICQNMMVAGRFIPMGKPPYVLEEGNFQYIRKFQKSGSLQQIPPLSGPIVCASGKFEVGDRVRFRDLEAAVRKYDGRAESQGGLGKGKVVKIPREQQLGYDVNTFVIEETQTWVEVLWQDLSKTTELATDLIPYHNLDDHDVWPGDFVLLKSDDPESHLGMKHIGVIQGVDAKERMAKIRWFENPQVQVLANSIIPGSITGKLKKAEEEVSIYDVIAHEAVGLSLGDTVLVAPERPAEGTEESSQRPSSSQAEMHRVGAAFQALRDEGLLAAVAVSLTTSLAAPDNSSLQAMAQMISNPEQVEAIRQAMDSTADADGLVDRPVDWIGEVVDRGLDGLVTVRLGGLDEFRDVRVPIERLFLVLPDELLDMRIGDDEYMDEDYETEEDESDSDATSGGWSNRSKIIEEVVLYEGGERIPDDGGDNAWSTDDGDWAGEDEDKMDESWDWMDNAKGTSEHEIDAKNERASSNDMPGEKPSYVAPTDVIASVQAKDTAPPPAELASIPECSHPTPEPISITNATSEDERGPSPFTILDASPPSDHAFVSKIRNLLASTLRRLTKEHKILSTSLPKGVVARTWESRLDLLRVLIVGPMNTPYELAPFVFDFQITEGFPSAPPEAFFHSWTNGLGRINPNLYEDGKICLSLLGTWHAQDTCEGWTSESSLLQVIVSLTGLVLVREPYYNEAGYDIYIGTPETQLSSQHYSERSYILSRGFVKRVLSKPVAGLEDEIKWLYGSENNGLSLLKQVVESTRKVVATSEARRGVEREKEKEPNFNVQEQAVGEVGTGGVGVVSAGGLILLKRHLSALEEILQKGIGDGHI